MGLPILYKNNNYKPGRTNASKMTTSRVLFIFKKFFSCIESIVTVLGNLFLLCRLFVEIVPIFTLFLDETYLFCSHHA